MQEGVIQFNLQWQQTAVIDTDLSELNAWRDTLWQLKLIGEDAGRYDGYGFGNVSQRYTSAAGNRNQFIISGTQTGHIENIQNQHYTLVTGFDPGSNRVCAEGPVRPSSESMTHGVIYSLDNSINCVMHVHSPEIWNKASTLGLPQTQKELIYGTPEMADEVVRLFAETNVRHQGIFSMAGHLDGVIAFGSSAKEAASVLTRKLELCQ